MSEFEKREFDASKTIQLDADDVELIKFHASRPPELPAGSARTTPPPLPDNSDGDQASAAAALDAHALPPPEMARAMPQSPVRTAAMATLLLALLAAAVGFGMMVGSRVNAGRASAAASATAASSSAPPTPVAAPPKPTQSASPRTLTLPTIEIKGH